MGSQAGSMVGSSSRSGSKLLSKRLLFTTTCVRSHHHAWRSSKSYHINASENKRISRKQLSYGVTSVAFLKRNNFLATGAKTHDDLGHAKQDPEKLPSAVSFARLGAVDRDPPLSLGKPGVRTRAQQTQTSAGTSLQQCAQKQNDRTHSREQREGW